MATECCRLGTNNIVFQVVRGIGQGTIRDNHLTDPTGFHAAKCTLQSLDDAPATHNCALIINVLIESSALRSALGLEWSSEVTYRISRPIKDNSIPVLDLDVAGTGVDILVTPSLVRELEITVLLHKLRGWIRCVVGTSLGVGIGFGCCSARDGHHQRRRCEDG